MKLSTARFALVIGSVSALGPMAIDLYLPGLQIIARELHAGPGQAELTLTSFFVGNTLGQLFYGPLSDRFGRRLPLLLGLCLYVAGSLVCSAAPTLNLLIVARLFQGLGGAAAQVIGSAVIRDLYTGHEAARLQATRMLVIAVSPILAPIAGAAVIAAAPWRTIFWISAGLGVAGLLLILLLLPETRSPEARRETRLSASLSVYQRLVRDRAFLRLVLLAGLTQGAFLAYIAGSSFVFITLNHASPAIYSLMFAINAAGFIGLAQFSPQLMRRFGPEPLIMTGTGMLAAGSTLILIAAATGHAALPVLALMLFFGIAGVGLVFGPSIILALREHGAVAGSASALIGFMQGCLGAGGAGLVSVFANGTATPMTGVMAVFALIAFGIAVRVYRDSRGPQPPVAGG
ncbi:MAG TPA: multidrug effflux MFS transporter [Caulobacteraceae bacterium]|nr:multidrug effflux MFS transporter [Caulobacteraceae bacterium]